MGKSPSRFETRRSSAVGRRCSAASTRSGRISALEWERAGRTASGCPWPMRSRRCASRRSSWAAPCHRGKRDDTLIGTRSHVMKGSSEHDKILGLALYRLEKSGDDRGDDYLQVIYESAA